MAKKKRRSRGTGGIVKLPSGNYAYQYLNPQGKRKTKSLRTKNRKEAETRAVDFEAAVGAKDKEEVLLQQARARKIINSRTLPLDDVWPAFLKTRPTGGAGTLDLYQRAFREFTAWANVERPSIASIGDVDLDTAVAYMEHIWKQGLSASTYNDKRNALGHITKRLANQYGIDANPWPRTERMKGAVQQKRLPLTRQQVADLLDTLVDPEVEVPCRTELQCLTGLCLFAGMRLVDAASLKWENVDDVAGCIRYTPAKTARTSGVEAVVPILPPLRRCLDALPRECKHVLGEVQESYNRNPSFIQQGLVQIIHGVTGEGKQEQRAQCQRERSLYGAHSLRHTFCTEAARAGALPAYLSMMTGDTLQTLQRYYVKVGYQQKPIAGFEQLPRLIGGEASAEPERQELRRLADTLPLDEIRRLLAAASG